MPFTIHFPFWVPAKQKKQSISDLNAEDLRKERLSLENEERRLAGDIAKAGNTRELALQEYHTARENGESHQAKLIARRIKNIDDQLRGLDFRHNALNKQQRMASGLIVLKDNEEFITRIAGSSRINSMDMVELQSWIEQATEEGELTMERLEDMIGTMDTSFDSSSLNNDSAMDDFMSGLDDEIPVTMTKQVAKSKVLDESIDASLAQVDESINRLEKVTENSLA